MATEENNEFAWVTGNDTALIYVHRIGAGGYGDVYEAIARKLVRPSGDITLDDIRNELRAVDKLCIKTTHSNIVKVLQHGKLPQSPYYFLDMELCGYNLESFIKDIPRVGRTAVEVFTIFRDIVAGIEYIHANGEVHRDLKPANVLYSPSFNSWKIGDFGLTSEATSKRFHDTRYARGTACYRAPEIIKMQQFTNKVDIWSLGCLLFELIFGSKAFNSDYDIGQHTSNSDFASEAFKAASKGNINLISCQDLPACSCKVLAILVQNTLASEPSLRPSAYMLAQAVEGALATYTAPRLDVLSTVLLVNSQSFYCDKIIPAILDSVKDLVFYKAHYVYIQYERPRGEFLKLEDKVPYRIISSKEVNMKECLMEKIYKALLDSQGPMACRAAVYLDFERYLSELKDQERLYREIACLPVHEFTRLFQILHAARNSSIAEGVRQTLLQRSSETMEIADILDGIFPLPDQKKVPNMSSLHDKPLSVRRSSSLPARSRRRRPKPDKFRVRSPYNIAPYRRIFFEDDKDSSHTRMAGGPCRHCGIQFSRRWRFGPRGHRTLCDDCGEEWEEQETVRIKDLKDDSFLG